MKKNEIEKMELRDRLLNRIKTVRLDDMEFWDELSSVTTTEDFAQIRQTFREWKKIDKSPSMPLDFNKPKGNFKQDAGMFSRRMLIDAGSIQEKDKAMFDFLLDKHEDGLIWWGEEDEEAFSYYGLISAIEDPSGLDNFYSSSSVKKMYNSFFNGEDDDA